MNERMEQYRVENIDTGANLKKKIKDVECIQSCGNVLLTRDNMKDYIEEPCLDACRYLYDLNIRTFWASANKQNVGNVGEIGINFDSLSTQNQQIFLEMLKKEINRDVIFMYMADDIFKFRQIYIRPPINEETTVGDVKESFMKIISNLKMQDVLYGRFSREEVIEYIRGMASCRDLDVDEETIKELGFCYCKEDDIYFKNEELLRKHLAYKEREQGQEL